MNTVRSYYFFLDDDAPPELLRQIKEYNVKFVFPNPTKLSPPVLGLHRKFTKFLIKNFFRGKFWILGF